MSGVDGAVPDRKGPPRQRGGRRKPRQPRGRDVTGILLLDKPAGMTSNGALQATKRIFGAAKAGHTGALDPLATGVLPLCFGEATKFSQYLLDSNKRYWTELRLGVSTESGDADGEIIDTRAVPPLTEALLDEALKAFRGDILQVPSMYSALKHQGQPLYKLARQGITVEREARPVTIFENRLLGFESDRITLDIACSKGTYVRSIAEDLGEALGCGAHVTALRRTAVGPFSIDNAITPGQLERAREEGGFEAVDAFLLPLAAGVGHFPEVLLPEATAYYLSKGQAVQVPGAPREGWVRLMLKENPEPTFLGMGEVIDDGRIAPRRLVVGK